jgi:hypothetical protein
MLFEDVRSLLTVTLKVHMHEIFMFCFYLFFHFHPLIQIPQYSQYFRQSFSNSVTPHFRRKHVEYLSAVAENAQRNLALSS